MLGVCVTIGIVVFVVWYVYARCLCYNGIMVFVVWYVYARCLCYNGIMVFVVWYVYARCLCYNWYYSVCGVVCVC